MLGNLAVLVVAYDRPRYLYVTLDGLFRCTEIGRLPVYVFFDGGGTKQEENKKVLHQFPVSGWLFRNKNLDAVQHYTRSIQALMSYGYTEVLYITDDLLLTSDAISYAINVERECFFTGLFRDRRDGSPVFYGAYNSFGNIVSASSFGKLYDYVTKKKYIGSKVGDLVLEEKAGEDAVYTAFAAELGECWCAADKHYAFHFGIRGRNWQQPTPELDKLESRLFSGGCETWVSNAVELLSADHSDPVLRRRLAPHGSCYR